MNKINVTRHADGPGEEERFSGEAVYKREGRGIYMLVCSLGNSEK